MKRILIAISCSAGAVLCLWSVNAAAQVSPALDRFSLSLGAYTSPPQVEAKLGREEQGAVSTGQLDGQRQAMPRLSAEFLLGDKHGISFDAYRYSKGYARRYAWQDSNFPNSGESAHLKLGFDLDVARLGYRYWYGSGNTVVGLGAGVGYYRVSLKTLISGTSEDQSPGEGFNGGNGTYQRQDTEAAFAPVLELGLRHAVNNKLRLFADASGIYKGGGGVHGGIYSAAAGLEWLATPHLGVSLAYAVTDVDLKRPGAGLQRFHVKFNGPMLSVKARF